MRQVLAIIVVACGALAAEPTQSTGAWLEGQLEQGVNTLRKSLIGCWINWSLDAARREQRT